MTLVMGHSLIGSYPGEKSCFHSRNSPRNESKWLVQNLKENLKNFKGEFFENKIVGWVPGAKLLFKL
jgi:hypothetical protein